MYKVTITQHRPNPEYEKQLQDYRDWQRRPNDWSYNQQNQPSYPSAYIPERVLEAELTDEEYVKVKRAVIEAV